MNTPARKHLRAIGPRHYDRDASQSIYAHYENTPSSAVVLANPVSNNDAYGHQSNIFEKGEVVSKESLPTSCVPAFKLFNRLKYSAGSLYVFVLGE